MDNIVEVEGRLFIKPELKSVVCHCGYLYLLQCDACIHGKCSTCGGFGRPATIKDIKELGWKEFK